MNRTNELCGKGLVVAGLGGGTGKSVVAVGLVAALAQQGIRVVPFKKGPDYIDAGWLAMAAGNSCYNLDPYLMDKKSLQHSFLNHANQADIAVVEGNRGLFDGVDISGSFSTAELSVMLNLPVILVVDCTKKTRTVAAMVLGCQKLEPDVRIQGVILNRIAGKRHENIVRNSVEQYTGVKVLGVLPKISTDVFPQRHLGITPHQEHAGAAEAVARLAALAADTLDLAGICESMGAIPSRTDGSSVAAEEHPAGPARRSSKVRIGVIRDAAFQFYYEENFEALQEAGAELIMINALAEKSLPDIDGLYIGGGFPETSARQLAANESFRKSLKDKAAQGLPVYAECGGLIYLGESMQLEGKEYPLVGIFPVRFVMAQKPQAHGYTVLETEKQNPFYAVGEEIKGHEFRYSIVKDWGGKPEELVLKMKRGVGFAGGRDGLTYKNVLALYTHIHAVGTPGWAPAFVDRIQKWKRQRQEFHALSEQPLNQGP